MSVYHCSANFRNRCSWAFGTYVPGLAWGLGMCIPCKFLRFFLLRNNAVRPCPCFSTTIAFNIEFLFYSQPTSSGGQRYGSLQSTSGAVCTGNRWASGFRVGPQDLTRGFRVSSFCGWHTYCRILEDLTVFFRTPPHHKALAFLLTASVWVSCGGKWRAVNSPVYICQQRVYRWEEVDTIAVQT